MMRVLMSLARHRLERGEKRGIYPLRALLDYPDEEIQRRALGFLILRTARHLRPKGAMAYKKLDDPKVLRQKKAEWLAWWEENEKTFQPKRVPMRM